MPRQADARLSSQTLDLTDDSASILGPFKRSSSIAPRDMGARGFASVASSDLAASIYGIPACVSSDIRAGPIFSPTTGSVGPSRNTFTAGALLGLSPILALRGVVVSSIRLGPEALPGSVGLGCVHHLDHSGCCNALDLAVRSLGAWALVTASRCIHTDSCLGLSSKFSIQGSRR